MAIPSPISRRILLASTLATLATSCTRSRPPENHNLPSDQMKPLFNGRDLAGWHPVNVHPNTFSVRDGMIISTGKPTGVMRTDRHYENFILELEYKHIVAGGNAGLFVWSDALTAVGQPFTRSIEVQILDGRNSENYTSHGDIFAIHGATMTPDRPHPAGWARCLPSERRANPAGQWNHYRLTANNGALKLEVNGKEVSGGHTCSPRKGYICLEAEGSECHFRNLRLKELPSTTVPPEQTATTDQGFKSIYNGIDLSSFQTTSAHAASWIPKDWTFTTTGQNPAELATSHQFRDLDVILDFRSKPGPLASILHRGWEVPLQHYDTGRWQRAEIKFRRDSVAFDFKPVSKKTEASKDAAALKQAQGPLILRHNGAAHEFANLYIRPA